MIAKVDLIDILQRGRMPKKVIPFALRNLDDDEGDKTV